jgi:molybdopterin synthase sulfur carrier subunit
MKLRYFAWVREKTGVSEEEIDLPANVATVSDVIAWLKTRGPEFEHAFKNSEAVRAAIDMSHVEQTHSVSDAHEIAFFPPVTGG